MEMRGHPKIYMIVTNDEHEYPVKLDVIGKKACCDFIGVSLKTFWKNTKSGLWSGKYKAIELGYANEFEEYKPESRIERSRRLYRENTDEYRERSRKYYYNHREERLEYGRKYRGKKN